MLKEKPSSVLSKIQDAAGKFEAATTAKHKSLGALYRIYRQSDDDSSVRSEILCAFENLANSARPKKCKSGAGKVAWLAFPHSKQRVSDVKKLLEAAHEQNITPDNFPDWLKNSGGIRATLLSLAKSQKKSGDARGKSLGQKFSSAFNSLWEAASSRRIEHKNPTQCTLKEGQKHVQITEFKNGEYTVVDAVLSGSEIEFGTSCQPAPVPTISEMAQQAKAAQDDLAPKMDAAKI